MREPKDKRTKAWKEWRRKSLSKEVGLGDVVEKITKATGIKKAFDTFTELTGVDCGCSERKDKLNKSGIKFRYEPNCFVKSEYDWFTEYLTRHDITTDYSSIDVFTLVRLYTRIFRIQISVCKCKTAGKTMELIVNDLKKIYETY